MIRCIAVVEDSHAEAAILKEHFAQYAKENCVEFNVFVFESGKQFLEKYTPTYDLVLLDIGLPEMDGMETALRLREKDKTTTIIFVTNMAQFAVRGYEVGAFDFIVKPVAYSNFALKLKRALHKMDSQKEQEIVLTNADGIFRIPSSQIKYIEVAGHKLSFYTSDGKLESYGNLKDVQAKLSSTMFVRCNSCYLVNLNFVRAVLGFEVLVDEQKLQMSRPKRKAFIKALNDYLGGGI